MKKAIETILFVLMNILGSPIVFIIMAIQFGIIGLIINLVLFLISFYSWNRIGNKGAKLSFSPSFSFGSKKYKLRK